MSNPPAMPNRLQSPMQINACIWVMNLAIHFYIIHLSIVSVMLIQAIEVAESGKSIQRTHIQSQQYFASSSSMLPVRLKILPFTFPFYNQSLDWILHFFSHTYTIELSRQNCAFCLSHRIKQVTKNLSDCEMVREREKNDDKKINDRGIFKLD